ncbi:MAG: GMC family oxidoreductase [Chryseolinea sp.]
MFIDSRRLPPNEVIETEVCIIGSGPAGISLAKEFIGKHFKVCLLESGDLAYDEETASLGEGEIEGDPFTTLRDMRYRQFGGNSNIWNVVLHQGRIGVRYVDLDPIDFEKRDWVPYSGWPMTKADLIPYYERAHKFCQLGAYDYTANAWESEQAPILKLNEEKLVTSIFKFGPSNIYSGEYRKDIDESANIVTYTNANVVEIESEENSKIIKRVHAACLTGNKFTVHAKIFIISAGGMENARLLLLSNKVQKTGLGNQNDVVGRYFMDHPLMHYLLLNLPDRKIFNKLALYDKRRVNNETVMGKFVLTESEVRKNRLLSCSALLFPRDHRFKSESKKSIKELVSKFKRGKVPSNAFGHIKNVALHVDEIVADFYRYHIKKEEVRPNLAHGEWSLASGKENRYAKIEVMCLTEQAPHPDNRITLSKNLDRLGCPQVKLTNRWNEIEIQSVNNSAKIMGAEFSKLGLGDLVPEYKDGKMDVRMSTHHNIGTTRMNTDPKFGVVDADCKVHGISNLYIAGSSVFPTGGYANPTLTIIALCMRLADHVKTKM